MEGVAPLDGGRGEPPCNPGPFPIEGRIMRLLPSLALTGAALLAAGCAATDARGPYDPVRNVQYSAIGHDPFWMVAIGDDRIVLTLGPEGGRADGGLESYAFPRVLPRDAGGVRTWESGDAAGGSIRIEARPGPCRLADGLAVEEEVRVTLGARVLRGCGGRPMAETAR